MKRKIKKRGKFYDIINITVESVKIIRYYSLFVAGLDWILCPVLLTTRNNN